MLDGNSLTTNTGKTLGHSLFGTMIAQLQVYFTDMTSARIGNPGVEWGYMRSGGRNSPPSASYVTGRTNILAVFEDTNAIGSGATAVACAANKAGYVADQLAQHPDWKIVLFTTTPRETATNALVDQATVDELNGRLAAVDALTRQNYRAWGAKGLVDLRCPGSPWAFTDYSHARFADNSFLWYEAPGTRLHYDDAGYDIVGGLAARAILNMTAR